MTRSFRRAAWGLFLAALVPGLVYGEVSRVEITSRRDLAGGRAFGQVGPYEQITGKLYFVVDPGNKRNAVIADLDKAPRNAAGKVELSADLVIVRPRDASKGNGIALFDIVNRGNGVVFPAFNGPATDAPEGEAGDGFVLSRGYTIVRVGWEFDVRREGAVRIDVPAAAGVTGLVRATFIPNSRADATVGDLVGYTPSDVASAENTLRVRTALGGDFVAIPRAKWQLKGNTVTLEGGFEPGQTYELSYLAANPPVAGLGFAAVRDAAAWVKYAADATVSAKYTLAYGSSQTGRWLRDFVYEGFNTDERNRQAFDAVIPHIGGAGGIDLNRRWSTPTSLSMESVTRYPFSDRKQRDPVTGARGGCPRKRTGGTEPAEDLLHQFGDGVLAARLRARPHHARRCEGRRPAGERAHVQLLRGPSQYRRLPAGRDERPAARESVRLQAAASSAPRRDGTMGPRQRRRLHQAGIRVCRTERSYAPPKWPGRRFLVSRRREPPSPARAAQIACLPGRGAPARLCRTWFRRSIATETSLAAFAFLK